MDKITQGKRRELHTAFKTVKEIAEEVNVSGSEVVAELEAMGYRPRYEKEKPQPSEFLSKPKRAYNKVPKETKEQIIALRKESKTFQQIANMTGINLATVKSVMQSHLKAEEKEPAPAATDTSSEEKSSYDYHTSYSESCQEVQRFISGLEEWLTGFIKDVYNNQSEDWQHGYDTGEKLAELRQLIRRTKGEAV